MSQTDRMASDLSRTGPVERDIEQVFIFLRFLDVLAYSFSPIIQIQELVDF